MKEIDDKELEQASGGFSYVDYPIAALELLGFTKHVRGDGGNCPGYEAELNGGTVDCTNCKHMMMSSENTSILFCMKKL